MDVPNFGRIGIILRSQQYGSISGTSNWSCQRAIVGCICPIQQIEIQRLIGWTRSLPPIQSINVCDIKYKRTETIFETKSIPKTKDGKEVIVEITYKITIGIRYDGIEETLDKKEWSKIVTYKDMQLPKLEKEDVDYESTGTWFDILHAMKAWNELKKIEKEQGYSYSFLEKMLFVIVGANVSKAESQEKFKYK